MSNEWINVKDQLPPEPGEYIVMGPFAVTTLDWTGTSWQSEVVPMEFFNQKLVTHWMPLPEPPVTN